MDRHPASPGGSLRRVVAVVAVGGAVGALGRHAAGALWPPAPGGFPWSTFGVNVLGCFAIGLLLGALTELSGPPHPLLRPFLGTGVLGGFTTFSAFAVEAERLIAGGAVLTGLSYLAGTVVAALVAVQGGVLAARVAAVRVTPGGRPG